jgi:excisionase family DNA binding protein
MAQKYYNIQESAKVLGISDDEVKQMLDRRELHGYRDGANWKFKTEEIEALAKQREEEKPAAAANDDDVVLGGDDGDDVLMSEAALGQSSLGMSGTVIGMNAPVIGAGESDIQLAGSAVVLGDLSGSQTPPAIKKDASDSRGSQFENLELTLDEDLSLASSTGSLSKTPVPSATGNSAIDLSGKELEDDDLVLGGSGKGSDVSIGGDSGISLVDPADSGLSLDEPLHLSGSGAPEESLELGEDDMIIGDSGSSPSGKTDDDFLLTPMDDAADGDESESGSQVIALDEGAGAMGMAGGSMAAMLDEDLSAQPGLDMGMAAAPLAAGGVGLLGASAGLAEGMPMQPTTVLSEAPYSSWQIAGLAVCVVFLMLCGMMMFDNIRNMWSWGGVYSFNSSLMDFVVNLF